MKLCAYCGAAVADGQLDCPRCGRSLFKVPHTHSIAAPPPAPIAPRRLSRYRIRALLLGTLLVLLGILAIIGYGRKHTLVCQRQSGQVNCVAQISWWGVFPLSPPIYLTDLRGVETEMNCRTVGYDTPTYRCDYDVVKLTAQSGVVRISSEFFNILTASAAAQTIGAYLHNDDIELVLHNQNPATAWVGSLCVPPPFLILGALILIFWRDS